MNQDDQRLRKNKSPLSLVDNLVVSGCSDWWRAFVQLGYYLAENKSESPCRIALLVPSRAYIAAFISLGASLASNNEETDAQDHYKYLESLDDGVALLYSETARRRPGRAVLEKGDNGEMWAVIHKKPARRIGDSSKLRELISVKNCLRYTKADTAQWEGDIVNRNHRVQNCEFLSAFWGTAYRQTCMASVYPVMWCFGIKNYIEQEMECPFLEIEGEKGSISEIVKLHSPKPQVKVIPKRYRRKVNVCKDASRIIFYDDVSSYLDHRISGFEERQCEIVVFDRADPNFQDGVTCWNNEYKTADSTFLNGVNFPSGVEVAVSRRCINV